MAYAVVTISVPHKLYQRMIRGTETMSDVWEAFDIIKTQIKKDEASIALARPPMISHPYDQDALISEEYDHRSPGC